MNKEFNFLAKKGTLKPYKMTKETLSYKAFYSNQYGVRFYSEQNVKEFINEVKDIVPNIIDLHERIDKLAGDALINHSPLSATGSQIKRKDKP